MHKKKLVQMFAADFKSQSNLTDFTIDIRKHDANIDSQRIVYHHVFFFLYLFSYFFPF